MIPRVLIEGLGDVSSEVAYPGTELTIAAQGEASQSRMVIRNIDGATAQYITGKRLTVDLDGDVIWAGFLQSASRQFWFEADHPDHLNRRWALSLVDLNILFNKRVVFRQGNGKKVMGPVYRDPTYDKDMIEELLANWLDLSADDLDTTTLVDQVAIVNPSSGVCIPEAQNFYPWNGGFRWGEAMTTIGQVPAAIFGLLPGQPLGSSPFGRLFYVDVDEEDAPFELSDRPGPGQRGYREMTLWETGTDLVNESFAWGAGKGANNMVFHHRTDSGSIADHLLWQQGDLLFNVWCQDTIEKVTDSIINGSPSSRRGHKNPINSVEVTTDADGLRVGQKVRFINNGYGYDEVLPIRKAVISFPTPEQRRYALSLSEALDQWGFQDPTPPFKGHRGSPPIIPDTEIPPGGCTDAICGITDTFDRVKGPGSSFEGQLRNSPWGQSDAGLYWIDDGEFEAQLPDGGAILSVDGNQGVIKLTTLTAHGGGYVDEKLFFARTSETTMVMKCQIVPFAEPNDDNTVEPELDILLIDGDGDSNNQQSFSEALVSVRPWSPNYSAATRIPSSGSGSVSDTVSLGSEPRWDPFWVKINALPTGIQTKVWWDGDAEPDWQITLSHGTLESAFYKELIVEFHNQRNLVDAFPAFDYLYVDDLDIDGVNRCTGFRFDSFNRTVGAGSWGVSDYGLTWFGNFDTSALSADGGVGVITGVSGSTTHAQAYIDAPSPDSVPWNNDTFTMDARFYVSRVDASSDDCSIEFKFLRVPDVVWKTILIDLQPSDGSIDVELQDNGGSTVDTYHEDTIAFAAGWYRLKVEVQSGVLYRFKIWPDGDAEPDWRATLDDTGGCGLNVGTNFIVDVFTKGVARTIEFDYIDFDYAGKPCYQSCWRDDFLRDTTSPDLGGDWTNTLISGSISSETNGSNWIEAASTTGQIDQSVVGAGQWSIGQSFRLMARMKLSWTTNRNRLGRTFNVGTGVGVGCYVGTRSADTDLEIGVYGTVTDDQGYAVGFGDFGPPSGKWFYLLWEHDPANHVSHMKIWPEGSPEPSGYFVSRTTDDDDYSGQTDALVAQFFPGNPTEDLFDIETDWVQVCSLPVGPS